MILKKNQIKINQEGPCKTSDKCLNHKNNSWLFLKENQFWIIGSPRLLLALLSNSFKMKFSRWTDGPLSAVLLLAMSIKTFCLFAYVSVPIIFLFTLFVLIDYFFRPDFSKKKEDELILSCKIRIPSKNTQCISGKWFPLNFPFIFCRSNSS